MVAIPNPAAAVAVEVPILRAVLPVHPGSAPALAVAGLVRVGPSPEAAVAPNRED
jgi:hypothetical protein